MRMVLSATLLVVAMSIVAMAGSAAAQTPASADNKSKRATTTAAKPPKAQSPAETARAMAQAERLALQSDLAWVGEYNGAITGEVSERMVNAIKAFQKDHGARQTGVLNPQERGILADTARRRQQDVGWKIVTDAGTGTRLGIPTKLVPQQTSDATGSKWTSPTGTVQIVLTRRKETNPTTAKLAEQEKKASGRKVDYSVVKPDFFVQSGLQGLKKFYVRGTFRGDEVRIMTILYDQAVENTVEPVVIAMSSAFNAFPAGSQAGPEPRKTVEYGSGIVVAADGSIITDRQLVDGCVTIAIPGYGNADRLAEDKERDLALLRIYGARGLKPLNLAGGGGKPAVALTGIADPQNQSGGNAVTTAKATFNGEALSPAPPVGFSGAAAMDSDGKFAGLAQLKPVEVAGPASASTAQATLVPAEAVRDFLKARAVIAAGTSADAKASVVRVICVRK
ncbi:MAG: serine protease [Bradyrhizobium sp.]|uniref:serine protease n=1 Tax=Bradyrhizobium sp. TaxID=376 RepID=UPI003D09BD41